MVCSHLCFLIYVSLSAVTFWRTTKRFIHSRYSKIRCLRTKRQISDVSKPSFVMLLYKGGSGRLGFRQGLKWFLLCFVNNQIYYDPDL